MSNKTMAIFQVGFFLALWASMAFVLGQYLSAQPAVEESKSPEKWLLVRDDNSTWVVSPKNGQWYIVPEANRDDFRGMKEGATVALPTLSAWDKCLMYPKGADMASLWRGQALGSMTAKWFIKL